MAMPIWRSETALIPDSANIASAVSSRALRVASCRGSLRLRLRLAVALIRSRLRMGDGRSQEQRTGSVGIRAASCGLRYIRACRLTTAASDIWQSVAVAWRHARGNFAQQTRIAQSYYNVLALYIDSARLA